jgi:hypothetical protein
MDITLRAEDVELSTKWEINGNAVELSIRKERLASSEGIRLGTLRTPAKLLSLSENRTPLILPGYNFGTLPLQLHPVLSYSLGVAE